MKTKVKQLKKLLNEEFRKLLEEQSIEESEIEEDLDETREKSDRDFELGYVDEPSVGGYHCDESVEVEEEGVSQSKRAKHGYDGEDPRDYEDVPGEGLGESLNMPTMSSFMDEAKDKKISPEKAKKILKDGEIDGKPLTPQQKKYFGFLAAGGKPSK